MTRLPFLPHSMRKVQEYSSSQFSAGVLKGDAAGVVNLLSTVFHMQSPLGGSVIDYTVWALRHQCALFLVWLTSQLVVASGTHIERQVLFQEALVCWVSNALQKTLTQKFWPTSHGSFDLARPSRVWNVTQVHAVWCPSLSEHTNIPRLFMNLCSSEMAEQ